MFRLAVTMTTIKPKIKTRTK